MNNPSPVSPEQNAVWHAMFVQSPVALLEQAIDAGMIPEPCLDSQGRDLLVTFLSREAPERAYLAGKPPSFLQDPRLSDLNAMGTPPLDWKDRLGFQRVALKLLQRSDVLPFERHRIPKSPMRASAIDLAMDQNLVAVVESMLDRDDAPSVGALEEWYGSVENRVGTSLPWLHLAASKNSTTLLSVLLEHQFNPNALDHNRFTPLFHVSEVAPAQVLVDAGAQINAMVGKVALSDHWAKQLRKTTYGGAGLSNLLAWFAQSQPVSTGQESNGVQVNALAWFEQSAGLIRSVDGSQGFQHKKDPWAAGWNRHVEQVRSSQPPLASWTRQQSSGLLKGTLTFVATMGGEWLNPSTSRVGAFPLYTAVLPNALELFGERPTEVRKGVTDWGLFALGAEVYKPLLTRTETPDVKEAVAKSHEVIAQIKQAKGTAEQWKEWMLETAAGIQRPKQLVAWQRVGGAIEAYLTRVGEEARKKEASASGGQRLATLRGHHAEWEATWEAVSKGVRLCSAKNSTGLVALLNAWGARGAGPTVNFKELSTAIGGFTEDQFLDRWIPMALIALAENAVVLRAEEASSPSRYSGTNPSQHSLRLALNTLIAHLNRHAPGLERLPDMDPALAKRVEEGVEEIRAWEGGATVTAKWKELRLNERWSAPEPSAERRKPRM